MDCGFNGNGMNKNAFGRMFKSNTMCYGGVTKINDGNDHVKYSFDVDKINKFMIDNNYNA